MSMSKEKMLKALGKEGRTIISSKLVDYSTMMFKEQVGEMELCVIRYYNTDIITFIPTEDSFDICNSRRIILKTGGFYTRSTKKRINDYQSEVRIEQENGLWYVHSRHGGEATPFFDGIEILNGIVVSPDKLLLNAHSKFEKYKKLIKEYCDEIKKLNNFPEPHGGDCWLCMFNDDKDEGHIISHLEEKYIHGTILINALKDNGYTDFAINWLFFKEWNRNKIRVVQTVRRFLKKRLGMPK